MSQLKSRKFLIICLLFIFSALMFGCEVWVDVNNIAFIEDEIVLIVGEEYTPQIYFNPTSPSNKNYKLISSDDEVVSVNGNKIKAEGVGSAIVKVESSDNNDKVDILKVRVNNEQTKLNTPSNLQYNSLDQSFSFESVNEAVGYTIKVNGKEINLGNRHKFYLSDLEDGYNKVLSLAVRADAPTYSKAFIASDYLDTIKIANSEIETKKIYQASSVTNAKVENGTLNFDKNESCEYEIKLNNDVLYEATTNNIISLTDVSKDYADSNLELSVTAKVKTEVGENNPEVVFFPSQSTKLNVYCLSVAEIEMQDTSIGWDYVLNAKAYQIDIDGVKFETHTNIFDLSTLDVYEEFVKKDQPYVLTVDTILDENSKNLIKTSAVSNEIKFNRLDTPVIELTDNKITWQEVDNASLYTFTLKYNQTELTTTTNLCEFDLGNYPSGCDYTFSVKACSNFKDGVYYLQSLESGDSEVEIYKQAECEIEIKDYVLTIKNSIVGDSYKVLLDGNLIETVEAIATTCEIELNDEYTAGLHTIEVTHLGNNANEFDSNKTSTEFIQLNNVVSGVEVKNNKIQINTNATLNAVGQILFTIDDNEKINATSYDLILNSQTAGEHNVKVFIEGNGSSVFSVRNAGGELKQVATTDFSVLQSPTLTLADKENAKLSFATIENASDYVVYKNGNAIEGEFVAGESFEIDLITGEAEYSVKALGNNADIVDSAKSLEFKVYRLTAPVLSYNSETNVLTKQVVEAENDYVLSYLFKHNDNQNSDYDFISEFEEIESENKFEIKAVAKTEVINEYHLIDSVYNTLDVDKIINQVKIYTLDRYLIIDAQDHEQEFDLNVKINDVTYVSNNNKLEFEDVSFDYLYAENKYVIELFDEFYNCPTFSASADLKVSVKFINKSSGNDSYANSDFSNVVDINFEPKTEISRGQTAGVDNQNIVFTNVVETRRNADYKILINDEILLDVEDEIVLSDNKFIIPIDYLYTNAELSGINSIKIVSLNTNTNEDAPTFSTLSDAFYFTKIEAGEISHSKQETFSNNSVMLSFNTTLEGVDKTYNLEVYNRQENEKINVNYNTILKDIDAVENLFTINLDNFNLSGEIYASLKIKSNASFLNQDNTVYVFDSNYSNEVQFTKIGSVDVNSIVVQGNCIEFDAVENAVAYEVYKDNGLGFEKFNTTFITTNSIDLQEIAGLTTLKIKAISKSNADGVYYTNSNLSGEIQVNKLQAPQVSTEINTILGGMKGYYFITLDSNIISLLQDENVEISLNIKNDNVDDAIIIDLKEFDENGEHSSNNYVYKLLNYIVVDPEGVLVYGESLTSESVDFSYLITSTKTQDVLYINSEKTTINSIGLATVTNLQKTSTLLENEIIEQMSWESSGKNILTDTDSENLTINLENGYIFKIKYQSKTYLSVDTKLKYEGNNSYASVITSTNIKFPIGYDDNENGTIEENEKFGAGDYLFSVKVMPKSVVEYNLLSSKFSTPFNIKIMDSPELTNTDGVISWGKNESAKAYRVEIYDGDFTTLKTYYNTSVNYFDFSNKDFDLYEGLYGVKVKALSVSENDILTNNNKTNVISSDYSEMLNVYRLSAVSEVTIDNGYLSFKANKYFTTANIRFVDTNGQNVESIPYTNTEYAKSVLLLGCNTWEDFDLNKETNLTDATTNYLIKIDDSAVLNLTKNRNYSIEIVLVGNSSQQLAIINSKTYSSEGILNVTKLNDAEFSVNRGKITFTAPDYDNLAYNLNNQADNNEFYNNVKLYKLTIKGTTPTYIYAIDYFDFIANLNQLSTGDYTIYEDDEGDNQYLDLYAIVKYSYDDEVMFINVYKDNTINFNSDYIYYYPISETVTDSEISFSGVNGSNPTSINIVNGGSFIVEASLVGGDYVETTKVGCLTSNTVTSKIFVRYGPNEISVKDGVIYLNNLRYYIDKVLIDNPVYRLIVSPTITDENSVITAVYLYYEELSEAKDVANRDNIPENYVIEYQQLRIADSGDVYFDFADIFNAGDYIINVKTLAGNGNGDSDNLSINYLLNAKDTSNTQSVRRLSDTYFEIIDGVLVFDQAYATQDISSYMYTSNYEITITTKTGENFTYEINSSSEGISIDTINRVVSYELPSEIEFNGKTIDINETDNYTINIKPIYKGDSNIVSASYLEDKSVSFKRSLGLSDVDINNGVLTWTVLDLSNYKEAKIIISYKDKNGLPVTITFTTLGTQVGSSNVFTYQIKDGSYKIDGVQSYVVLDFNTGLIEGSTIYTDYDVEIRVISKTTTSGTLNSNGLKIENVNRLNRVDSNSIKSNNGEIEWQQVENASGYEITLSQTGIVKYTFTTNGTEAKLSLDNQNIVAGSYIINIRALGEGYLNAINSNNSVAFTKLAKVTGVKIENGKFTWNAVNGAQRYKVIFSYTNDGQTTVMDPILVQTNYIDVPSELGGEYRLTVQAVGFEDGYVINGDISDEFIGQTQRPEPVKSITYDSANYVFNIEVADDFTNTDSLKITYTIDDQPESTIINYDSSIQDNIYKFTLTKIGRYSNVSVVVERALSISSLTRSYAKEEVFDIFESGDGDTNSYVITTVNQLLNISLRTNANYILGGNINLSGVDIASRLSSNSAIIANEFTGMLDGDGNKIYAQTNSTDTIFNIQTENTNFALFKSLNNAIIKNLTFGDSEISINISNSFDSFNQDVIKLSSIANDITNSTLTDVSVRNVKFDVAITNSSAVKNLYIGGISATSSNSTISGCISNITVNFASAFNTTEYVSGMVAYATNTIINSSETATSSVSLTVTEKSGVANSYDYFGGVVARMEGETSEKSKIENVTASVNIANIKVIYFGGITGYSKTGQIINCNTSGNVTRNINTNTYYGGVVGYSNESIVKNNYTSLEFDVTITNTSSTIYVGGIVGYMNTSAQASNNTHYIYTNEYTTKSGTNITIGKYGN